MISRFVGVTFLLLTFTIAWHPPYQSLAQQPADTGPTTGCEFVDWEEMDSYIDHMNMAYAYLKFPPPLPHEPGGKYAKALTYDVKMDSLGLVAFLALPATEREFRTGEAIKKRERVARFYRLILSRLDIEETGGAIAYNNFNNRSVTDCIAALINATGLDPASAEAWYDLAFFTRIVGDGHRSLRCLKAAFSALEHRPLEPCTEFRQRLTLDYAWLCRDLGLYEESLAMAFEARELGADLQETQLVEGLALAGLGRFSAACKVAQNLGEIRTRKRTLYSTMNKRAAYTMTSNFAERWIEAMAYLATGDYELAYHQIKGANPTRELPHACRYWNDVGLIYELNDKPETASMYGLAAAWLPYMLYYPLEGIRGYPPLFSQTDIGLDYFRTHRSMYVAGSLFSYAGITALESELEKDPLRREQLARYALDAMDVCRRRMIRPTESLALRGQFLFSRADYAGALVSLRTAMVEMAQENQHDAQLYLLAGLAGVNLERYQEATVFLERASHLEPERATTWNTLGVVRVKSGNRSGALAAFDRSIILEPESAATWYNRGLLYYRENDFEAAHRDLQMAIMLRPGIGMADQLLQNGPGEEVEFEVETAEATARMLAGVSSSRLGRQDTRSLENGLITIQSGHPQPVKAESYAPSAEKVARLEERYAEQPSRETRQMLAQAYIRAGRPQEAREILLPFWGRSSSVTDQTLLLEADRAVGDTRRAQLLALSLQKGPPSIQEPTFWSLVAFICLDAGLKDEGMAALNAAISLDPSNLALRRHRNLLTKH